MARGVKTGGRQKGSVNKVTRDLRFLIKDLIASEFDNIEESLEKVEPKERLDFLIKLLPYTLPRYEVVAFPEEPNNNPNKLFDQINQNLISRLDGSFRNE